MLLLSVCLTSMLFHLWETLKKLPIAYRLNVYQVSGICIYIFCLFLCDWDMSPLFCDKGRLLTRLHLLNNKLHKAKHFAHHGPVEHAHKKVFLQRKELWPSLPCGNMHTQKGDFTTQSTSTVEHTQRKHIFTTQSSLQAIELWSAYNENSQS